MPVKMDSMIPKAFGVVSGLAVGGVIGLASVNLYHLLGGGSGEAARSVYLWVAAISLLAAMGMGGATLLLHARVHRRSGARATSEGSERHLLGRLRRGGELAKLDALQELGGLGSEDALPSILEAVESRSALVRRFALRAAARTISRMPGARRGEGAERFVERLVGSRSSPPAAEEALLLLGPEAEPVVFRLLSGASGTPLPLLRAALEAARRLPTERILGLAAELAFHPDPEVWAASLRILGGAAKGRVEERALDAIRRGLRSEHDFVRSHASRAAIHLPAASARDALWEMLGDRSWWVRLAAAETFRAMGAPGEERLRAAAVSHPDRYGREMAGFVGREAR